jgi:peptidyl-prolyl cis-trans isomerase A (cyclophilin A)
MLLTQKHIMKNSLFKSSALCCWLALSACGGGDSGPAVASIAPDQLVYGRASVFTLAGKMLDESVSVSAQGCSDLTQVPGATNTSRALSCTVNAVGTGAVVLQAKAASGAVLKEQAFDVPLPTSPAVIAIQSDRLMYSKSTQWTFTGQALDKDFTVSTKGCVGLALVAGGSSTSKSVTCNITAAGPSAVMVEAKLANGTVLLARTIDVLAPQVTMTTSLGTMVVELDAVATPLTTNNFLQYVNDKFYDNTIIHRIVTSSIFVAQGGWLTPAPAVQSGQRAAISLEVGKGLSNVRGTIAMARTAQANSATSQYFFNLADNVALDTASGGYAVFGKLVSGLSLLDALVGISTSAQYGLSDFPSQSVTVQSASQTQ